MTPLANNTTLTTPLLAAIGGHVLLGAEHVLLGLDHLLFLLTVIVGGLGWRYWLTVVTGFTVAHSITLALAMFGVVRLPASLIEPLIAASIVLMALDNLLRAQRGMTERLALVCACGLLHGLGFAASMEDIGLDSHHPVWSLLGFNLGIELGQGLFLLAVLAALWALRRAAPRMQAARLARGVSGFALVMGVYWLLERLADQVG